ncbi:MAG: DinB family protein [Chloroflexi bacterium]|nr:DinB family protein [Chloroflexota bacterium]
MRLKEMLTLFDYNCWANHRLLESASRVSQAQFLQSSSITGRSLRGTLIHTLRAEWTWRLRCQGVPLPALPTEEDFPTVEALRARWVEEEDAMRSLLKGLGPRDMDRLVSYKDLRGNSYQNVLWQVLLHVVNHGTQTRSEAATLLTQFGQSPGDMDFILFLRQAT